MVKDLLKDTNPETLTSDPVLLTPTHYTYFTKITVNRLIKEKIVLINYISQADRIMPKSFKISTLIKNLVGIEIDSPKRDQREALPSASSMTLLP